MTRRQLPRGVKATSGGTFERNDPFSYFIAGAVKDLEASGHSHVLVAVNELGNQRDLDALEELCEHRKVLLDSGIFNLANSHAQKHGVSHDVGLSLAPDEIDGFDSLWDRYGSVVTRFKDKLWGLIELDQGGIANKPTTRARIEEEFGVVPIPVYHPLLDGWDYYDTLAKGYDRICFGNLVQAPPSVRLRLIHAASERARQYPYLWTHLLGVYPNQNLLGMPLRGSCDSSSWLTSLRWMPSWKVWAMTKMVGSFPPPMWYIDAADGVDGVDDAAAYNREMYARVYDINANICNAMSTTLEALAHDTHPWLIPPPYPEK